MDNDAGKATLKPLDIKCTSSDCEKGLHCFRATRKMKMANEQGRCRACGMELVDWPRVHSQSLKDLDYTFDALRLEMIRHYFWHLEIDVKAVNHARRKGRVRMRAAAEKRLRTKVAPAEPAFDGRQTPRAGNAIFYAQHATASCCRTCVESWHGIPKGRALTEEEISYLTELVVRYLDERLPELTENGEKVPPLRGMRASAAS
ncbi:MAG: DUF4186 family protein [Actinomycetota bacterium]